MNSGLDTTRGNLGLMQAMASSVRAVPDELLTRKELAERMHVSVRTVDKLKKLGMPFVPWTGTMVRFRPNEAMAWAEQHGKRERARRAA